MDAWYEDDEKLDQHLRTLQGLLDEKPLVSGYEQIAHVSSGGQAVVYSATRKGTEQRVALKMFNEKNAWWGRAQIRLQNEARELERLQDPRIVGFVEFLEDRLGRPVLVMEWVDGGSLADHLPFGPRSGHFQLGGAGHPGDELLEVAGVGRQLFFPFVDLGTIEPFGRRWHFQFR